jgi:hypothetical protein
MWIPEVSLGNATFQEPVQDVEKVPKTRWKLVANSDNSPAISASRRWGLAFSVGTNHASRLFT